MASIFSQIVEGEIPCFKVAETDKFFAFLDINPLAKGHTLVIPKKEIDYFFDLDDNLLSGITLFAKQVAIAIEKVIPCERIGMTVLGLEVPHAHIHLIPLNSELDMDFSNPRVKLSKEEFEQIAELISNALI